MIYGDDPAQGVIKGRNFFHGPARFSFTVPEGFQLINTDQAVYAKGTGYAANSLVIFAGDRLQGRNLIEFTSQIWKKFTEGAQLRGLEELNVNGMAAVTGWTNMKVAKIDSRVRMVSIHHSNDQAYFFLMATPLNKIDSLSGALQNMTYSFNRLSEREASKVKGKVIKIVTVQRGDTVASLANYMAFDKYKLDRFLVMNGLNNQSQLRVGQRVKLVVYQ